jgi:hypothetical protein
MTEGIRARMSTDPAKFTVLGVEDGPCYLKAILNKFYVETNATNFYLRQKLHNLPITIVELNYNIAEFNDHTMEIVQNLAMGGHTSDDLLVYVFNAYLKVPDNVFHRFIERRKEAYDDGSLKITVRGLMDMALTKYNQINQEDNWQAKSPEQEQIVALIAQLQKAQSKNETKSKSNAKSSSSKDSKKNKSGARKYPDWRYERNGQEKTMERDGKTWYWCDYHQMWRQVRFQQGKVQQKQGRRTDRYPGYCEGPRCDHGRGGRRKR